MPENEELECVMDRMLAFVKENYPHRRVADIHHGPHPEVPYAWVIYARLGACC